MVSSVELLADLLDFWVVLLVSETFVYFSTIFLQIKSLFYYFPGVLNSIIKTITSNANVLGSLTEILNNLMDNLNPLGLVDVIVQLILQIAEIMHDFGIKNALPANQIIFDKPGVAMMMDEMSRKKPKDETAQQPTALDKITHHTPDSPPKKAW